MVSQKQKFSSYWRLLGLLFFSIGIALKIHSRSLSDVVMYPGAMFSGVWNFFFFGR